MGRKCARAQFSSFVGTLSTTHAHTQAHTHAHTHKIAGFRLPRAPEASSSASSSKTASEVQAELVLLSKDPYTVLGIRRYSACLWPFHGDNLKT